MRLFLSKKRLIEGLTSTMTVIIYRDIIRSPAPITGTKTDTVHTHRRNPGHTQENQQPLNFTSDLAGLGQYFDSPFSTRRVKSIENT